MKRRKLIYVICLISVIILNCLYINYQFFIMLVLVVFVPFISWVWYRLSRTGLRLYVGAQDTNLSTKNDMEIIIKTENACPVEMPWGRLYMQIRYSNMQTMKEVTTPVTACGRRVHNQRITIHPKHCGIVSIYVNRLEVRDFLQLCAAKYHYNVVKQLAVFPQCVTADGVEQYPQQEPSYIFSYCPTDNTEVLDLRPYVEGDALNRIHWKRSMYTDEYIVRQYGDEMDNCSYILVDLTKLTHTKFRDDLDLIYQAAYSIAYAFIRQQKPSRFVVWDDSTGNELVLSFEDETSLMCCMAELMSVECTADAMENLNAVLSQDRDFRWNNQVLVTAQDYKSDIYWVVNVREKDYDLAQTLSRLEGRA